MSGVLTGTSEIRLSNLIEWRGGSSCSSRQQKNLPPSPVSTSPVDTGEGVSLSSVVRKRDISSSNCRGACSSRVPGIFSSFKASGVGRLTHNKSPLCPERAGYFRVRRLRTGNGGRVGRPIVCAASRVGRGQWGKSRTASRHTTSSQQADGFGLPRGRGPCRIGERSSRKERPACARRVIGHESRRKRSSWWFRLPPTSNPSRSLSQNGCAALEFAGAA